MNLESSDDAQSSDESLIKFDNMDEDDNTRKQNTQGGTTILEDFNQ